MALENSRFKKILMALYEILEFFFNQRSFLL